MFLHMMDTWICSLLKKEIQKLFNTIYFSPKKLRLHLVRGKKYFSPQPEDCALNQKTLLSQIDLWSKANNKYPRI